MALIDCYECKKSISSEAPVCIHCGAPLKPSAKAAPITFGRLPRDEKVPEVATGMFEPAPKVVPVPEAPVPVSRRRRVEPVTPTWPRPVESWLKIMVFLLPPFFVWFLLRPGHSLQQRLIGFGWLGLMILLSKV
ncbi:hypothetical protein NYP20_21220 [Pseudomonas sp. N3-W]|uniref:Zinc ribbon domain-containing protein n=1 Tax=Pseudomonas fungipugnans TaxID=3024217 RepID=A0ABT6QKV4_9PSED|nr:MULTISPECIES: hypothetical protein [unclassified Pseudomonas]MDI2591420.1 hypothetical protein [Pseudomonas sp. 681]UWF47831.1 hypothetical protein NYP20_21220 [Pseudomonas sp. N3-W]